MKKRKVAIFEDNHHLRETLKLLVDNSEAFECVLARPDCSDMISHLNQHPCDVVLMDIEMPGMNGIEATRAIRKEFPEVQVLIQTVFQEDDHIFDAICAGASGYLLKSTSPEGYLWALEDVCSGGSPMTPGIARRVIELFRNQANPAPGDNSILTPQEKKVLQFLVDGKSYKMIAAELSIAVDTVKSHIRNLYAKLQVNSGTEAVSKALRERLV